MLDENIVNGNFPTERIIPSVYSDALSYVEDIAQLRGVSKVIVNEVNKVDEKKLDKDGDFKGSWHGYTNPVETDPGIQNVVNKNTEDIKKFDYAEILLNVKEGEDISIPINEILEAYNSYYRQRGLRIVIPQGRFKATQPILIEHHQIVISGKGRDITVIEGEGNFDLFEFRGKSFNQFMNGSGLHNLSIDSPKLTGTALKLVNVALGSSFKYLGIYNNNGKGIFMESCFDFVVDYCEIRGTKELGIHLHEINELTDNTKPYEEMSYITFNNITVVDCNRGGVQWLIEGGDSYFINNCKPTEGTVGIRLTNRCTRTYINGLYFDGRKDVLEGTIVEIQDTDCRYISINNINGWNASCGVRVHGGKAIKIGNCHSQSDAERNYKAVDIRKGLNVMYDGIEWNYQDFWNSPMTTGIGYNGIKTASGSVGNFSNLRIMNFDLDYKFTIADNTPKLTKVIPIPNANVIAYAVANITNNGSQLSDGTEVHNMLTNVDIDDENKQLFVTVRFPKENNRVTDDNQPTLHVKVFVIYA